MFDDIQIDGHSRRFHLAVLGLGFAIVITALLAVGAVANAPGDQGIGLGTAPGNETTGPPTLTETTTTQQPGGDNGHREDATSTTGPTTTPTEGDPSQGGDETSPQSNDQTMDSFSAGNSQKVISSAKDLSPAAKQLAVESTQSLIRNQLFTVDTRSPSYWRTATYGQYTGQGFTRNLTATSGTRLDDELPQSVNDSESHVFTLWRNASQLPTPDKPVKVSILSGANPRDVTVRRTASGSVIVTDGTGNIETLPAGTQYRVTALDESQSLPEQGDSNTPTNMDAYTSTPDFVPADVGVRAMKIVNDADAETRAEKATAIKQWLQTNKDYSVGATHNGSHTMVGDFVTEMDAGNSEHFAAAMTMMLREVGVPARYATGYTQGRQTDNGLFSVGSMDKHAWVEYYTEDGWQTAGGWTKADPTPQAAKSKMLSLVKNGSQQASEYGVSDAAIEAWASGNKTVTEPTNHSQGTIDQGDQEFLSPPYNISVSPAPKPGIEVTVTISKHGQRVEGVTVLFNGDPVGTTGASGQLDAAVPYTSSLEITVESGTPTASETAAVVFGGGTIPSSKGTTTPVYQSIKQPSPAWVTPDNDSGTTYEVPTNVSVDTTGILLPGETITLNVQVNGTGVPAVPVYIAGEKVGTTNESGGARVQIPADVTPGSSVPIRVERGDIQHSSTLALGHVEVRVTGGLAPLPETTGRVKVVAVSGDTTQPLPNTSVAIYSGSPGDGEAVTTVTTGENGKASFTLPWADTVTAVATVDDVNRRGSLGGLYYYVGALAAGALLVLAGLGVVAYRRDVTPAGIAEAALRVLYTVGDAVQRAGSALHRGVVWVYAVATGGLEHAREQLWWAAQMLAAQPGRFVSGVRARLARLRRWLMLKLPIGPDAESVESSYTGDAGRGMVGQSTTPAYQRLRDCWRWLVRYALRRTNASTKTATEVEQAAVEKGLPGGPVRKLRTAFERVEYGFDDAEEQADEAETAVNDLQTATTDTETEDSIL